MQYRDLSDDVCVVTGASSGIGEATARALVSEGARVALVARSADRIEALAPVDVASALITPLPSPAMSTPRRLW